MKKPLILIAVAAALLAGGYAWWRHGHGAAPEALVWHGNVDIRQISLAFDASGRVTALHAEEGDQVKAGALLGVLDTRALALQAEQVQAQIAGHEQNLLRLRHGARPQEVAQARSRLAAAQAEATRAAQDVKRLDGIAADTGGRGVSMQELDRARSALAIAQARTQEQDQALRLTTLGARSEDIAAAEAQLKGGQAQLALLRHQIAQGQLRAPADAVVRSRLLEPGDMATPQRPVFALALTHPKWVRIYISEPELGKVRPGMAAAVTTDSQPGQPVAGKVGYISSIAEFTPKAVQTEELRTSLAYEVRIVVEDAANALRMGQPATVRLAK